MDEPKKHLFQRWINFRSRNLHCLVGRYLWDEKLARGLRASTGQGFRIQRLDVLVQRNIRDNFPLLCASASSRCCRRRRSFRNRETTSGHLKEEAEILRMCHCGIESMRAHAWFFVCRQNVPWSACLHIFNLCPSYTQDLYVATIQTELLMRLYVGELLFWDRRLRPRGQVHTYMHACMCVRAHTHARAHAHTHTHTQHTHTHTHTK